MDFMAAKHGMADALRVVLTDDGERLQTRANLTGAIDHLLAAGADQGSPGRKWGLMTYSRRSAESASSPAPRVGPISRRSSSTCCSTASCRTDR